MFQFLKDVYYSIINSDIWEYNLYTGERWEDRVN